MLRGTLFLLIVFRLLWPPGICACQLFHPEPAHHDHDDDHHHHPGCPGSKAAAVSLCPMRADAPSLPPLSDPVAVLAEAEPVNEVPVLVFVGRSRTAPDPAGPPLYLTLRALLI